MRISVIDKLYPKPKDGTNGKDGNASRVRYALSKYSETGNNLTAPSDIEAPVVESTDTTTGIVTYSSWGGWTLEMTKPTTEKPYVWAASYVLKSTASEYKVALVSSDPIHYTRVNGQDGADGAWTEFKYNISNHPYSDNVNTPPTALAYSEWQDKPIATTVLAPYLWMRIQKYKDAKTKDGSPTYVRLTGDTGAQGAPGAQGKLGPIAFFAGAYDSTKSYTRTDELVPIVYNGGSYYYPKENGTLTGSEPSSTNTAWTMAQSFDIVIAKMVMATFGQIASAIFSGDWMFSQRGREYDTTKNAFTYNYDYKNFDPTTYTESDDRDWRPMVAIDFKEGIMRAINMIAEGGTFKDIDVSGKITANLFYSKTKTVTFSDSNPEYVIDPVSDPATTFFVNEPKTYKSGFFFRLPKASNYDGLEITIFCKHQYADTRISVGTHNVFVGCKDSTDHFYVKQNVSNCVGITASSFKDVSTSVGVENIDANFTDFIGTTVKIQMNNLVRFKSIGGAWYAIEGIFTGE